MPDILDAPGQPPISPGPPPRPSGSPDKPAVAPPTPSQPTPGDTAGPKASKFPEPKTKEGKANLASLMGDFLEDRAPKKPKKADDATPPAPKDKDKPKPAPAKPKVPAAARPAPGMTPEQIAELAARTAAQVAKPPEQPKKDTTPVGPDLDEDDRYTYDVLKVMEELHPGSKGIADKFKAAQLDGYDYQEKWEKANPGKEWNPEDPEHEEFRKTIEVDWDDAQFDRAKIRLEAKALREEEKKHEKPPPPDPEIERIKQEDKLRRAEPEVLQRTIAGRKVFWSQLGEEFKDFVDDNGRPNNDKIGKTIETEKAELARMIRETPELAEAVIDGKVNLSAPTKHRLDAAMALDGDVRLIYLLDSGTVKEDPKDPIHAELLNWASEMEVKLSQQSPEDQLDDKGRPFLPSAEYVKLTPEKRANYWTLTGELLIPLRVKHWSDTARRNIASDQEKIAQYVPKEPADNDRNGEFTHARNGGNTPPPDEEEEPETRKPLSPSSMPQSKTAAATNAKVAKSSLALDRLM